MKHRLAALRSGSTEQYARVCMALVNARSRESVNAFGSSSIYSRQRNFAPVSPARSRSSGQSSLF